LTDEATVPSVEEPSAVAWAVGGVIAGRYHIDGKLGRGGMGTVYRATDNVAGTQVALKLLGLDSTGALVRFKREFHAARRLSHPNCVRVHALMQHQGRWFFSMEYVNGGHLPATQRADPVEVAKIAAQVLAALDHVHARQIVHRDIKPQNILVDRSTLLAKLSDLGIAQVDDAESTFTVGQLMGSARYLSPEQARGEAVDARADLYSLGIVLYELLTGTGAYTPATRDFEGWLEAHRALPAQQPTDPSLPAELVAIVMRLLSKDPRDRFPTAAATFDAVAAWLERTAEGAALLAKLPPLERKGYVAAPEFVGRTADLDALHAFARDATSGDTSAPLFLAVHGDGGVGKSRLVSRVLPALARRKAEVLVGACPPQGGAPYAPLRALLALREIASIEGGGGSEEPTRPEGGSGHSPRDSRDSPGRDSSQQPRDGLSPRESARFAVPVAGFDERDGQLWRLYRGVVDAILERSRTQPFVIVVEDVQWADPASIDLLGFVVRSLAAARAQGTETRAGIIVTHRREIPREVRQVITVATELGVAREIALSPFGLEEASELVAAMLSTARDRSVDAFTGQLLAHSDATPLFIGQALRLLVGAGQLVRGPAGWNLDAVGTSAIKLPTSVRDAIGDRSSRLKVGTQRALGIAAVRGPRFALDELLPLMDMPEPELLDDIDEAVREGFIYEAADEGHYVFAHDRIRESIYERLPREEATRLHRAIADQLGERHRRSPEFAAEIAHHAWQGGDARRAYIEWWRAGDLAMQRYAFARAVEMYGSALDASRALGRPPRAALYERHGDACLQAGQYQDARASYQKRMETAQSALERAELLRRLAEVEHRSGNTAHAGDLLEDVLRALGFRVPRTRIGLVLGIVVNVIWSWLVMTLPVMRRKKQKAFDRHDQIVAATCGPLAVRFFWSDFVRAAFYQFAGMRVAERLGPSPELTVALAQQGLAAAVYGFPGISRRYLDRARAVGEEAGTALEQGWEEIMRGMSYACAGRVDDHITALQTAEKLVVQCPETLRLRQVWTIAGEAYLESARLDDADKVATKLMQMSLDVADVRGRGWGGYLQGFLLEWRGDLANASSKLEEAVALSDQSGDLAYQVAAAGRLVSVKLQLGATGDALAVGIDAARKLARAHLRNPTVVVDGVTLAAAALARRNGPLAPDVEATVRGIARGRGRAARAMCYSLPWFLVGKGAWYCALGKARSGEAMIARGLEFAEQRHLLAEQYEAHRFLAQLWAGDPARGARHAAAAERLRGAAR
jgi:tetratricopeptide (TPR) repeat protein